MGELSLWESFKSIFGWRAICSCGQTAYYVDNISNIRRCVVCAAKIEAKNKNLKGKDYNEYILKSKELQILKCDLDEL